MEQDLTTPLLPEFCRTPLVIATGQYDVRRDAKLLNLFDLRIRKGKRINHDPHLRLIVVNEEGCSRGRLDSVKRRVSRSRLKGEGSICPYFALGNIALFYSAIMVLNRIYAARASRDHGDRSYSGHAPVDTPVGIGRSPPNSKSYSGA